MVFSRASQLLRVVATTAYFIKNVDVLRCDLLLAFFHIFFNRQKNDVLFMCIVEGEGQHTRQQRIGY